MKKIAVFGGVFDPVHKGHIRAAEIVDKEICPDILLFMPSGRPPHKRKLINAGYHRLNMLKLAVSQKFGERAVVSDFEIKKPQYCYTAETLAHLKGVYGSDSELYFVMGADNVSQFEGWYRPDIISSLSKVTVVSRPSFEADIADVKIPNCVICKGGSIEDSSTKIRELSSRGEDFESLVPSCVYDYIKENGLYKRKISDLGEIERIVGEMNLKRMPHILGVRDEAEKLAKIYGADVYKAKMAALLHDATKNLSLDEMLNLCEKYDIMIDDVQRKQRSLLHGITAEAVARFELGIDDREILNAVRYHTTGCPRMELLTKIIYLADSTEVNRDFNGVEELRELSYKDIDRACLMSLDKTIVKLIGEGAPVHTDTMNARNMLLEEIYE